jgi:MFS family permease
VSARENLRLLAAGLTLTFVSSYGQTYFIALFGASIRQDFELTHGQFGAVYTAGTLASAVTLVWIGKAVDTTAVRILGLLTFAALAVACVAMAVNTSLLGLIGVIFGLRLFGQAMSTHLAMTAMSRWFDKYRGRALSIAGLGLPAGEAVLPLAVVASSAAFGWRTTWVIAAISIAVVAAPVLVWLLRNEAKLSAEPSAGGAREESRETHWTRAEVLRDPMFYGLIPIILAPPFMFTGLFFHQIHLAETVGWDVAAYAASFSVFAVGVVGSSLATGWLVDRVGSVALLPWFLIPMACGLAFLLMVRGAYVAPVYLGLIGLSGGSVSSMFGVLWADLYGTRHLGAIRALAVALMVAATALAPSILGLLIDEGVGLLTQIAVMIAYCIFCIFGAMILAPLLQARINRRLGGELSR